FIQDLKSHLLGCLLNHPLNEDHIYLDVELATVKIVNNRIYNHKVLHMNYMTYDMQ
ncbi:hypothetical protein L208DRAFT_1096410, partial [Tricholoma matsutake]